MQTHVGIGFEIDLDDDWRRNDDAAAPEMLYFRHQALDASLACFGIVTEPHDSDLDALTERYLSALLDSLDEAAAALGGKMALSSYQPQPAGVGREIVVSGAMPNGQFVLLVAVRPWLLFHMRAESVTLPEATLWTLLNEAQGNLHLGEQGGPSDRA